MDEGCEGTDAGSVFFPDSLGELVVGEDVRVVFAFVVADGGVLPAIEDARGHPAVVFAGGEFVEVCGEG